MPPYAARLTEELVEALDAIDDGELGIAEVWRRIGVAADALGVERPSYEEVRLRVHALREMRVAEPSAPSIGVVARVATDVVYQRRPPEALIDVLEGRAVPPLRRR